jgi:hypothetical protein
VSKCPDKAPITKEWIHEIQDIVKELKDHLQKVQNQHKLYVDKHRVEHTIEVGDLVYLRLQPSVQASIKKNGTENLKPHFYGPYRVKGRWGQLHMS